jgi:hypothetical protein
MVLSTTPVGAQMPSPDFQTRRHTCLQHLATLTPIWALSRRSKPLETELALFGRRCGVSDADAVSTGCGDVDVVFEKSRLLLDHHHLPPFTREDDYQILARARFTYRC